MIKVSETRSALRRLVLTKAADDWSNLVNGHATAQNTPLAQIQANATLRASGNAKDQRAFQRTPRPGPTQAQNDAWRAAEDKWVADLKARMAARAKNVVRPVYRAMRPVIGAVTGVFK